MSLHELAIACIAAGLSSLVTAVASFRAGYRTGERETELRIERYLKAKQVQVSDWSLGPDGKVRSAK